MKVYNKEKTQVLETYDLSKGYLASSKLNGESINVYVPYSQKTLISREISELKSKLSATDYQAIKYAEGLISETDYASIKAQRQAWRDRINILETEV